MAAAVIKTTSLGLKHHRGLLEDKILKLKDFIKMFLFIGTFYLFHKYITYMEMYITITPASVYSSLKSTCYCSHTQTYVTPFLLNLYKLYINTDIHFNSLTFQ